MFTMDCDLTASPVKILLVDDEPSAQLELKALLSKLVDVHTADSGEAALAQLEHLKPDLILLDIEMPGINGLEVCQRIRDNPATRDIAIIFVTAHSSIDNEIASLSQGAVDFIAKPIDHKVCELRVKNLLMIQQQSKKLFNARQEVMHLVGQVPNFISYWDKDWHNLFCNDEQAEWFGFSPLELLGQHLSLIFPANIIALMQQAQPDSQGLYQTTSSFEVGLGNMRSFIINWSETAYQGNDNGFLLTLTDISEQKQIEHNLQEQKDFLNIILGSVAEGVMATDNQGLVTFINAKAQLITGWRQSEALNQPIEQVVQLRDPETKINTENPIRVALRQQR